MTNLYVFALLIGVVCGLRSMTPPAIVCWGAHLGWFNLAGSPLAFLAHPASLVVFGLMAIGELIADKFPQIPRRTEIGPLMVRVVLGAMCGGALAISAHPALVAGAVLGGLGGILGAFGGFYARRAAASKLHPIAAALLEDVVAIAGGFFAVSRF